MPTHFPSFGQRLHILVKPQPAEIRLDCAFVSIGKAKKTISQTCFTWNLWSFVVSHDFAFQGSCPPWESCLLPLPIDKTFSLSLFLNFIFNWKKVTLQYYDGFCHISTWISHRYTYAPLPLKPPSSLILYPIPLGYRRVPALDSLHHTANSH